MATRGNDLILAKFARREPIVLPAKSRLEHVHITGLTNTGKSRYLESLIRQDIRASAFSKCGMMVIDPHGQLFDGIMNWVAANQLTHLPIIPIDFRRQDQIVSYNVLRQRKSEPSVIVDTIIKAMAHVWGQGGTDETPLFERWASNILHALYSAKLTLADAAHLFTPEGLVIAERIDDPMIREDWIKARYNRKDFETAISSSVNRFRRFLLNPTLRAMFGQGDVSLDLGNALEEGQIILVSLARNGGTISRENADLFATLLLSDLWAAADERGKSENARPFYVYVDEFQRFLTPTMAESLAESRGFGISMTLADQFPRQILKGSKYGERIYDEVMENTRTKVVFRLRTRANLQPVAESLFMDTFDADRVKYQHASTKVLGHELRSMRSTSESNTNTVGGGEQESHTSTTNHSKTDNRSHTKAAGRTKGLSSSHTNGKNWNESEQSATGRSLGYSETDSLTEGTTQGHTTGSNWSDSESDGRGGSRNTSGWLRHHAGEIGPLDEEQRELLGPEETRPDYRKLLEQQEGVGELDEELDDLTRKVTLSETQGNGDGENWIQSMGKSKGGSEGRSSQNSLSRAKGTGCNESANLSNGRGSSTGGSQGDTVGKNESLSETESDTEGEAETYGESEADTIGHSRQWSESHGTSVSLSPMLFPVLGKEAEAPIFRTIEEQIFMAMAKIAALQNREAYVLTTGMKVPVKFKTSDVHRADSISELCTSACTAWYLKECPMALPLAVALGRILDRDAEFARGGDDVCKGPRRRITSNIVKPINDD